MEHVDKLPRVELRHQISRDPVVRLCQPPFECHHLSVAAPVAVARCPGTAGHHVGTLHIGSLVAGRGSVFHGQGVEERLDGRTDLAPPAHHHVVLEVGKVDAAHISLHLSRVSIHAHEAGAKELLVITDRVDRCHHSVHIAVVGEDRHVYRRVEGTVDLFLRGTVLLHRDISLTLSHGTGHDGVDLLLREVAAERGVGTLRRVLFVEGGLKELRHMPVDRLLGIALHTRVDGRMDTQAVGIDIIEGAVFLRVLLAPSAERVGSEGDGVDDILPLVPRRIVLRVRPVHHHVLPEELAEIDRRAVLVVGAVEVESHGLGTVGLIVGL